jgi:hypothetical protein
MTQDPTTKTAFDLASGAAAPAAVSDCQCGPECTCSDCGCGCE